MNRLIPLIGDRDRKCFSKRDPNALLFYKIYPSFMTLILRKLELLEILFLNPKTVFLQPHPQISIFCSTWQALVML